MRNLVTIFLLISSVSLQCCAQKNSITTFILVRHAEKDNDDKEDPSLKPEGVERSEKLALLLKKTGIDAIYSTNFKRTRNTVQPVASEKGLRVMLYEAFKPQEIEKMLKQHEGGTVLISGHSNNIPWIANLLSGKEEYKNFPDEEYSNVLIVSVVEKGRNSKVTWLTY